MYGETAFAIAHPSQRIIHGGADGVGRNVTKEEEAAAVAAPGQHHAAESPRQHGDRGMFQTMIASRPANERQIQHGTRESGKLLNHAGTPSRCSGLKLYHHLSRLSTLRNGFARELNPEFNRQV
jgi:hypothetical protein